MMSINAVNFRGMLTPAVPASFTAHCATCGKLLLQGAGAVNLVALDHECPDTTSLQREMTVTWEEHERRDAPAPPESVVSGEIG
jgi:hypothetical protein